MEQKDIGTIIKEIRLRSGLSQVELADISGLSLRSIQRIENNNTIPRGDSLKRIAGALNVNIEELTASLELKNTKLLTPIKELSKNSLIWNLIRLQLACFAILILVYGYYFIDKLFKLNLPVPANPKPSMIFIWVVNKISTVNLYVLLMIAIIKWAKTTKNTQNI